MIDNKNISILVFLPNLLVGGAEETTLKLVDYLAKHNYKVNLVVATNKISSVYEIPKNINYINLGHKRLLTSCWKTFKTIKNINPDLVFSTLWYSNILTIFISRILSKKCVVREAGLDYRSGSGLMKKIFKLLSSLMYNKADKVIAISNSLKENLHHQLNLKDEKVVTVFNPVSDYIDRESLEKLDLKRYFKNTSEDTLVALSAIRFDDIKYSYNLFLALKEIKHKDTRLLLVGEGNKRNEIKTFLKKNELDEKVVLTGWKANVHSFIYSCDLYISSSKYEGLGNAYLAAQLLQKKCLASNIPASLEINSIFKNGNTFNDEVEDILEKITDILQNSGNQKNLSQDIIKTFSVNSCFKKYIKIFESVVE